MRMKTAKSKSAGRAIAACLAWQAKSYFGSGAVKGAGKLMSEMGGERTLALRPFEIAEPLGRVQMESQNRAGKANKKAAEEQQSA